MKPKIDLIGKRFGRLTVISITDIKTTKKDIRSWLCLCDCGTYKAVPGNCLRRGNSKSCGCIRREGVSKMAKANVIHGKAYGREYKSWQMMKNRCLNPNNIGYERYSKLGVYKGWINNFKAFYEHVGDRPHKTSLDRIDNNKGYNKANCRWATKKEQSFNRAVTLPTYTYKVIEDIQKQNNISFRTAYLRFYRSANYILKRDQRKKKENERSKRKTN